jgi:hypothetical protein
MNEDVDYDPWDDAPDEIDPAEIREMLYESGIKSLSGNQYLGEDELGAGEVNEPKVILGFLLPAHQ